MKAIRVHSHGGPDVLAYEDVDIGQPGPGEVRVRNRAIGVNFVDIYLRAGALPRSPARRHRLRDRRSDDAEGPDSAIFAAPYLPRRGGSPHSCACSRRAAWRP